MSAAFSPAEPAFAALRPGRPAFSPATDDLARDLAALTGGDAVLRMRTDGGASGCGGYYRVERREGPLFLKVVDADRRSHQIEAARIAAWLSGRGVAVNPVLPGWPRLWREEWTVFAHPFIDGRFADTTVDDMAALGRALAALHLALADAPFAGEVKAAWSLRRKALEAAQRAVLGGALSVGPDPAGLRAGLSRGACVVAGPAQPVHNDLHYANLLFPSDGGAPVILDFEDARHSHQPPVVDLAKALERFVLVPSAETEDAVGAAIRWGEALLGAYVAAGGSPPPDRPDVLAEAVQAQSLRALCDLTALAAGGRPPNDGEWRKFFALLDLADRLRPSLRALESFWRATCAC